MKTIIAMHQHQGGREYQQDIMARKPFGDEGSLGTLCILADGMGGYEGGEIASMLISKTFMDMVISEDDMSSTLKQTLYDANQVISDYKSDHPEVSSMGSTAIAAFFTENSMQWISVGDSLLYGIDECMSIRRLNANHSIAGLLELQLKKGEISQKEVDENPNKHMLTSAITGEEIAIIDISSVHTRNKNHLFLLASDGIETLNETEIINILQKYDCGAQWGLNDAATALVNAVLAKEKRNQDNVTVLLVSREGLRCKLPNAADKIISKRIKEPNSPSKIAIDFTSKRGILLGGIFFLLGISFWLIMSELSSDSTISKDENQSIQASSPTKKVNSVKKEVNNTKKSKIIEEGAVTSPIVNAKFPDKVETKKIHGNNKDLKKVKVKSKKPKKSISKTIPSQNRAKIIKTKKSLIHDKKINDREQNKSNNEKISSACSNGMC